MSRVLRVEARITWRGTPTDTLGVSAATTANTLERF